VRFAPKNWNDILAIVLLAGLPIYFGWLLKAGVTEQAVMLIVGQALGWLGQVVTFYFRKSAPPEAQK
jgi:hypothetical protein